MALSLRGNLWKFGDVTCFHGYEHSLQVPCFLWVFEEKRVSSATKLSIYGGSASVRRRDKDYRVFGAKNRVKNRPLNSGTYKMEHSAAAILGLDYWCFWPGLSLSGSRAGCRALMKSAPKISCTQVKIPYFRLVCPSFLLIGNPSF